MIACQTRGREVTGSTPGQSGQQGNNSGQVVYAYVLPSTTSVIWYRPHRRERSNSKKTRMKTCDNIFIKHKLPNSL